MKNNKCEEIRKYLIHKLGGYTEKPKNITKIVKVVEHRRSFVWININGNTCEEDITNMSPSSVESLINNIIDTQYKLHENAVTLPSKSKKKL